MEIKGIHEYYSAHPSRAATSGRQIKKAEDVLQPGKGTGCVDTDTVTLSPQATFQARLDAEVQKYGKAAQKQAAVDQKRIDRLKIQYMGGQCPVSGIEVADAILRRISGSGR